MSNGCVKLRDESKERSSETHRVIVHLEGHDHPVVGFYKRPNRIIVIYELNVHIRINGEPKTIFRATNMNVVKDRFLLLLELPQAFLHPQVPFQSVVLPID